MKAKINPQWPGALVTSLMFITFVTSASSALYEYEGFEYSGGTLSGQNGGTGWGGAWSATNAPLSNDGVSLQYPVGVFHTAAGSRLAFTGSGGCIRTLGTSMNLGVEGNVFYFSALVRASGDFKFEFYDSGTNVRWRFGRSSANNAAWLGVSADYPANGLFPAGETVYVVAKMVTHASANDEVHINIYRAGDTVPLSEPATWMAATNGSSGVTLTRLQIRNISNTALEIDEIRIGTSYQEVVIGTPSVAPIITVQPVSVTNYQGLKARFSVTAAGASPLLYQWKKDGVALEGATNSVLVISNIQASDAGQYTVEVSNSYGSTNSAAAILSVIPITGIETGLQAKWSLDETSGITAHDSTSNQNHGTLYNFPIGDSHWIKGVIGGGLNFYGTNYIEVPDRPVIGANLVNRFSISAWIRSSIALSTNGNTYRCFEKGDNIFFLQGDGNTNNVGIGGMNFAVKKNNQIYTASIYEALDANRWYHLVGTYDGDMLRVYVDGVLKGTRAVSAPIDDDKLPLRIGSDDSGKYFNGAMDEVCIWDRPLTESEILQLAGKSGPPQIISHPQSVAKYEGMTVRLSVEAFGTPPLRYLWYKDGVEMRDAIESTLTIYYLQGVNAGEYRCRVSNAEGEVLSDAATVTVTPVTSTNDAIKALYQFNEGWEFFTADSSGNGYDAELRGFPDPDSCWVLKDGTDWALAFNGQSGRVVVTNSAAFNAGDEATFAFWIYPSNYGTLTIGQLYNTERGRILNKGSYIDIQIVDDPGSVRKTLIANGAVAPQNCVELNVWQHFAIVFRGGMVTFYKNGFLIGEPMTGSLGPTGSNLIVIGNNSADGSTTNYYCGLMDNVGIWARPLSEVEIMALAGRDTEGAPVFVSQPQSAVKFPGSSVSFRVEVTGKRPVDYFWYHNGVLIEGVNTNNLVLTNLAVEQSGTYVVVAQNSVGAQISQPATLTVQPITNITVGLMAYWNFDETEGTMLKDSSTNGFDAYVQNGAATAGVQGVVGGAFNFDGVDDFAIVSNSAALNFSDQLTISFWVNPRTISVQGNLSRIIRKDVNFDLSLEDTRDSLRFYGLNKAIYDAPANVVVTNQWQHFALVLNNGYMQYYKNGKPIGNPIPAQLGPENTSDIIIGNFGPDMSIVRILNGYLDELGLWARALSAVEIDQIYKNGLLGKPLTAEYVQLQIVSLDMSDTNVARLVFTTPYVNRQYAVQQRKSFAVNWSVLPNVVFNQINQNTVEAVFEKSTNPSGFYRIVALPPGALFTEDFESGASGWTHGGAGDNWELGTPVNGPGSAHSGANVYATGLAGNIQLFSDCYLRSPVIDLGNVTTATLSFWEWRNIDVNILYHQAIVRILDPDTMGTLAEVYREAGSSGGWVQETIRLPDSAVGRRIIIEFRLVSDDFNLLEGWYIDDVQITQ